MSNRRLDVLALIPARGGSKGVPRKNLASLGKQPLVLWTIAAALDARGVSRCVVSTDDPEIAEVARSAGAEVPFHRPAALADDDASAIDVVHHALQWFRETEGWQPDAVAYLQPTSPFRKSAHIDLAISLMLEREADTVVSVVSVPHNMLPLSLMSQRSDGFLDFLAGPSERTFRRQDKFDQLWARNGPAILLSKIAVLETNTVYGSRIVPLKMSMLESIDIDTEADLTLANCLASYFTGEAC